MKALFVSPFAPYRDGIATYAMQELRALRSRGWSVDVMSPLPSAARWHTPLGGPSGALRLVRRAADYDRTIIQFGPEMMFGRCRSAAERVGVWTALLALARSSQLDLRIHEIEYGPLEQNPLERRAARAVIGRANRVTTHTEAERDRLYEALGGCEGIEVIDHGRHFIAAVVRTKAEARSELALPQDRFLFLSIGFLQQHKGFDLAVDAIESLQVSGAELHIVGSARVDHPDIIDYVSLLERRCAMVPAAWLHNRFVDDETFDLWLQAADAVVLPYREIWSSGVVERARLFETPLIVNDLPQLRDQVPLGTLFANDAEGLATAMAKCCAAQGFGGIQLGQLALDRGSSWAVDPINPDRSAIQAQVVDRARSVGHPQASAASVECDLSPVSGAGEGIDRLMTMPGLGQPTLASARPGVSLAKRVIDRVVAWRLDPIARQVEGLQRAVVAATAELDERIRRREEE